MASWERLEDPCSGIAALHNLYELLVVAMCPVLCDGQDAADVALFAGAEPAFYATS
jgi:hypothetical protein